MLVPARAVGEATQKWAPAAASSGEGLGIRKRYSIPAMEMLGFDFLLNRANKQFRSAGAGAGAVKGALLRAQGGRWPALSRRVVHLPWRRAAEMNWRSDIGYTRKFSLPFEPRAALETAR
ncbi:MAG: hypothetical protein ACKVQA_17025 [Burkholderiales bacterium]